jgi:hypothetical protein
MGTRASWVSRVITLAGLAGFAGCGGGTAATDAGLDHPKPPKKDAVADVPAEAPPDPDAGASTCGDHVMDGDETGVDCGGSCPSCAPGVACKVDQDCQSKSCLGGICDALHCNDGVKNGNETDVDCGGACPACFGGKACSTFNDCVSSVCAAGHCANPTCMDSVQNQGETDIDCGGSACPKCADFKKCAAPTDCIGGRCLTGVCTSCMDKVTNGGETDIDCGGMTMCARCADGKVCKVGTDCFSGRCLAGTCVSCTDGKTDGDETDIDCGGATCPACMNGRHCVVMTDCVSKLCSAGSCVAANCTDKITDGNETDVDCGGPDCGKCAVDQLCKVGSDCATGVCSVATGKCAAPSCTDGVKNQGESDADCGGTTTCPRCPDFKTCTVPADCATGACTMGFCGTVGCKSFGTTTGYLGCERNVPVTSLPCDDIRLTGTKTNVLDDSSVAATIPFTFNFYGTPRASVQINSPGTLNFNGTTSSVINTCLPTGTTTPMISVFWEHLHAGGLVYYQTIGTAPNRKFVILWDTTVYLATSIPRIDVRAVLYEGTNNIDVCYVQTNSGSVTYNAGASMTSGIQNGAGAALQYSCNTPTLVNGLLLSYMAQ